MSSLGKEIPVRFWMVSGIVGLTTLGDALLYAVLPADPASFGVKVWQIGILLGANRFVRLITNEIAGRMSRRIEHRISLQNKQLFMAAIVGGLITAGYMFPLGFIWLLFLRITWGACWSLLRLEGYISALRASTKNTRGRVFGFYQSIIRFGQGGGVLVGGFLTDVLSITSAFFLFSVFTICTSFFALSPFAGIDTPIKEDLENQKSIDREKNSYEIVEFSILILGIFTFALSATEQMTANLTGRLIAQRIPTAVSSRLGAASVTGALLSFRALVIVPLGPLLGTIMDRYGRLRVIYSIILVQLVAVNGLCMIDSWYWTIGFLVAQLTAGVIARYLLNVIAADMAPTKRASVHVGRFTTFMDLGTALGPIIGFAAYAAFGIKSISPIVWLLLLTAAIMTLFMKKYLPVGFSVPPKKVP